jgi:hypothetical protein
VTARLERLTAATTHLATSDIVYNRELERRWPADLIAEQRQVVAELRAILNERDSLQALLSHADPRVRTLALGALFMREDPRDLPAIARLTADASPTFPYLGLSPNSAPGPLPLSEFESPQTVGSVAQAMIRIYLEASPSEGGFDQYWARRAARQRTAGWFLVKMQRATRQTTPFLPQYQADIRRVLGEIEALPPAERAWTLLYVAMGIHHNRSTKLVPDAYLTAALKTIGPDPLLKFLRKEPPTDDPDLRADNVGICRFILSQAPYLFRASDADAILAAANGYRDQADATIWFAAASRVRGLADMERGVADVKEAIQRISLRETLGARNQFILAFALWQVRGAEERAFLTDWIYTVMQDPKSTDVIEYFFRDVEDEARPDTNSLLASVVRDARFEQANWTVLSRLLMMVNAATAAPLVETSIIYDSRTGEKAPQVFANWRILLRERFAKTP